MAAKFTLSTTVDGQHHFNLVADNGEIVLSSETYTTAAAARDGIESVRRNAGLTERYERRKARDGQDYFVLKAANGEVIGTSEMYRSTTGMENGIQAVVRSAATAED